MMAPSSSSFFHKRQRRSDHPYSRSEYFLNCPSSPLGSVNSLGSLFLCFSHPANDECLPIESSNEATILEHFDSCSVFISRWNNKFASTSKLEVDAEPSSHEVHQLEERLTFSARHLCRYRCFLRAFAPCREWHSLRTLITKEFHDFPLFVNQDLKGWRCVILPDSSHLPRVAFISPSGATFRRKQQVLQHLSSQKSIRRRRQVNEPDQYVQDRACQTPRVLADRSTDSPFGLLEELFADDPWALLMSTILLNRTSRVQVDSVLHEFLSMWPTCEAVLQENNTSLLAAVLKPLGMHHRRAKGIVRFCLEYKQLIEQKSQESSMDLHQVAITLNHDDILGLFHCGVYASAAYHLFIRRDLTVDPVDHALTMYTEYQKGLRKFRVSSRLFV